MGNIYNLPDTGVMEVESAANGMIGSGNMGGNVLVVNNTSVTANSVILPIALPGGPTTTLRISNINAGTSFTIVAGGILQSGPVGWVMFNRA